MKTEKLIQFASKQTAIVLAVLLFIPMIGVISTLLLMTIANLFCDQLQALMILSVVATTSTLAVKQLHRDTNL